MTLFIYSFPRDNMEATNELYKSCERMIDFCVGKVAASNRLLDKSELKSVANTIFMDAARSYDSSRGASFKTYLYEKLKKLHQESDKVLIPDGHNGHVRAENIDDFDDFRNNDDFKVHVDTKAILPASIAYTEKMADDGTSELFSVFDKVLSPESINVLTAIDTGTLDGKMPVNRNGTKRQKNAKFSRSCALNAKKMWMRRYRNIGWTEEMCERSLDEIRKVVRQFNRGGLPCRIVPAGA